MSKPSGSSPARGILAGWAVAASAIAIAIAGVCLALLGWFPRVVSAHGRGIQLMLDYTLAVTGAFFVVGHLVLAWLIVRAIRPREASTPNPSRKAQRLVGIVPALVMAVVAEGGVMVLGLPVFADYYGDPPEGAVAVEITGRQFFWTVRYPGADAEFGATDPSLVTIDNPIGLVEADPRAADDVVLLNEVHLPTDRPAKINLRSYDVIHSFFVPELRLKQDMVPGMTVPVWFEPTAAGTFEIACNQICGLGHYRMRGFLHLQEGAEFDPWLASQRPLVEELR
jgi:cytochrome c oxidase subunit 2